MIVAIVSAATVQVQQTCTCGVPQGIFHWSIIHQSIPNLLNASLPLLPKYIFLVVHKFTTVFILKVFTAANPYTWLLSSLFIATSRACSLRGLVSLLLFVNAGSVFRRLIFDLDFFNIVACLKGHKNKTNH